MQVIPSGPPVMTDFDARRLLGAWQLVRWYITYEDGAVTEPLGPDATGLLIYTADGWMSATIMAAGRPLLSRRNPRAAPVGERAAAFDSYFNYCCQWRVVGDAVEHQVTLAHNPALVGTVQVRKIRMQGGRLTLSADEPVEGAQRVHRLTWRRAGPGSSARRVGTTRAATTRRSKP